MTTSSPSPAPRCDACLNDDPADLLIILSRDHPDRPPRWACRPGLHPYCLEAVSPGGHDVDAIALLEPPTDADRAAFAAARDALTRDWTRG